MRTIFKSYGMLTSEELKELEKDTIEYLMEEYPEEYEEEYPDDSIIYDYIIDNINFNYEDEYKYNLNTLLPNNIIAIADIGRWNGGVKGCKIMSNNLRDVLSCCGCDEIDVYSDGHNIRMDGYHHDGRNHVLYRLVRDGVDIEKFIDKIIYNGEDITNGMLNYYTKSLVPYVNNIYGWYKRKVAAV